MTRSALRWVLALLWVAAAGAAFAQRVDVVVGYYAAGAAEAPRRVDVGSAMYHLEAATMPVDRDLVRSSKAIFVDRFPDGGELFRDDMEAFHVMIHDGGLLVLVAGPESSAQTAANFDYLGTRFDFKVSRGALAGPIAPTEPFKGPLDGNVWNLEKGSLGFDLSGSGWRTWFRHPDSGKPVIASRRIGQGLLVLVGTHELERNDGGRAHNALTLVDWGLREVARPTPEGAPPPAPVASGPVVAPVTAEERARIVANPSSELLADRIAELRRAYGISDRPAADKPLLIPVAERQYLPFRPNISDVDERIFSVPDYQGLVLVLAFWASWDPESRAMFEGNAEAFRAVQGAGTAVVGFSLDREKSAPMAWMKSAGLDFRLVCDGTGWHQPLVEATATRRIPRIVVIDTTGRIAHADLHPSDLARAVAEARLEK